MTTRQKPLAEITQRAIEVLSKELGPADTARFINQFTTGFGDYTFDREVLLGQHTLDQVIADIRGDAGHRPNRTQ